MEDMLVGTQPPDNSDGSEFFDMASYGDDAALSGIFPNWGKSDRTRLHSITDANGRRRVHFQQ